ncbi:MAG: biotin--[acetyl-CoA-carboxylase] ligase [Chloroflexi bacterium]|nr:biotin--[acetyl-CoA-carboxylase] ligase [Chloroflexota bacterium]
MRSALSTELGRSIEHHARIASTQARARSLADSGEGAALVVADEQTEGHGRQGRPWIAPPRTALLASWVLRPLPADPALFALLAGVAVARALADLGVPDARLKWPNDVQLGGKKVAGALADAVTAPDGGALVLGIGVNVRQTSAELAGLAATATSLAIEGHRVDRLALLARLCRELDRIARTPDERRAALAEWRSRASMLGHEVEVRSSAGPPVRGVARDLADDGALVLRTSTGDQRILAGEVSLRFSSAREDP